MGDINKLLLDALQTQQSEAESALRTLQASAERSLQSALDTSAAQFLNISKDIEQERKTTLRHLEAFANALDELTDGYNGIIKVQNNLAKMQYRLAEQQTEQAQQIEQLAKALQRLSGQPIEQSESERKPAAHRFSETRSDALKMFEAIAERGMKGRIK